MVDGQVVEFAGVKFRVVVVAANYTTLVPLENKAWLTDWLDKRLEG